MIYRSEADVIRMTPRQRGAYLVLLQLTVDNLVEQDWLTDSAAMDCIHAEQMIGLLWALPTQMSDDAPVGYFDGTSYRYVVVSEARTKDEIVVKMFA